MADFVLLRNPDFSLEKFPREKLYELCGAIKFHGLFRRFYLPNLIRWLLIFLISENN